MMMLTLVGLLFMAALIGVGFWVIAKNVSFKRTTDRYKFVKTKDENGNEITKVVDLEDNENA